MGRAIVARSGGSSNVQNAFPELADDDSVAAGSRVDPADVNPGQVAQRPDTYSDRLFKYIPAEVVTLYIGLSSVITSATNLSAAVIWMVFAVCLIGTPLYLWRMQDVRHPLQLAISTVAFAVWIFAIGGPFLQWPDYKPVYGALLLPVFTFFVAMLAPRDKTARASGI